MSEGKQAEGPIHIVDLVEYLKNPEQSKTQQNKTNTTQHNTTQHNT